MIKILKLCLLIAIALISNPSQAQKADNRAIEYVAKNTTGKEAGNNDLDRIQWFSDA